jgi:DNA ligase (NAD+)
LQIQRLGLYPGAKVKIKRAGDVIPKILSLSPNSATNSDNSSVKFEMPKFCPICNSPTFREVNTSEKASVIVRCSGGGTICSAQAVEQIRFFLYINIFLIIKWYKMI